MLLKIFWIISNHLCKINQTKTITAGYRLIHSKYFIVPPKILLLSFIHLNDQILMKIRTPYLLFIGDAKDPLSIKMAKTVADWRPDLAVGEFTLKECETTTNMPPMDIDTAKANGAKSFLLGFTNSGGYLEQKYIPYLLQAIEAGMDIVSGLHQKLEYFPEVKAHAKEHNVRLVNVRHPKGNFKTGNGNNRLGKRLLTVGTDCSVGKMYSSMTIYNALQELSIKSTFRATGQSGIAVAGSGVAVDCVISDFIAGAVEELTPANVNDHWDIIEGQGSLYHPAFAGVSLGLLHGSQPDALVLCHAENREHMRGIPGRSLPSIEATMELNLHHARLTNPNAQFVGICLNTSMLDDKAALELCNQYQKKFDLPCMDPLRHGVSPIIDNVLAI